MSEVIEHRLGLPLRGVQIQLKGYIKRKGQHKREPFQMNAQVKDAEQGLLEIDLTSLEIDEGDVCLIVQFTELPQRAHRHK